MPRHQAQRGGRARRPPPPGPARRQARRPPTRGRPREPETQADTQDNTQAEQPPTAPRASPPWLLAHFENVARRPQQTAERGGYEIVRVVAARDADAENLGGEIQVSDGSISCRVIVPRSVDMGQPLQSAVGTLLKLHGARVVADRTRAPGRNFGFALSCSDLEPVDGAVEADDEQRPDVDADGHVTALLRASAGRGTMRAVIATLDEHQPGSVTVDRDGDPRSTAQDLLGADADRLQALRAAIAPAPARRSPRRRAAPAPAPAPAHRSPRRATPAPAPAPARSPARRATPRASPVRRKTPRTPASPPPPLPQRRRTPRGPPPTPGLDAPMRATAERLVAERQAAEAVEPESLVCMFSPEAPGYAPSPAQLPRPRLAARAPMPPLARAKRRPILIMPLRYKPRKRAASAPTVEVWQRPAPTVEAWQRWPTAEEATPARQEDDLAFFVNEGHRRAGRPPAAWAPPPPHEPAATWAPLPQPPAAWASPPQRRPDALPAAKKKRRGISIIPMGFRRVRARQ